MISRLRIALLVLLGLGLVGPATAGVLYVPVALNETVDGLSRNTELWVTNPTADAVLGFYARFIPMGADGTDRADWPEAEARFVAPGASVRFSDVVPGGRGMLEIEGSPELIVSAKLVSTAIGFGTEPEPVDLAVISQKNLIEAGGSAWLLGFEKQRGVRYANLGVANFGHEATNCTVEVRQADGLLVIQNVGFQVPALTMLQFEDAFSLLGLDEVAWGARVKLTCDQPFWAYSSIYNTITGGVQGHVPAVTAGESALEKPVEGEEPPPPPPPPGDGVVFELPGNFLTCNSCGNWQFDMPFGGSRKFRKIVIDFDVWAKQWDGNNPNGFHCVFWLNNGDKWSNMMGYLNSKGTQNRMTFQVNYGVDRETNQSPGMQTGTWYHVHYEYDMESGEVWYQLKNGSSVRASTSYQTSANSVTTSKMFIQFGTQIAEGPESRTPGWKWSDFRAVFYP